MGQLNFNTSNNKNLYKSFVGSFNSYGFFFNGMERDDEIVGKGGWYEFGDYGFDSRLVQRSACDPEWQKYPGQSPYATFNGNPILYTDPTGKSGIVTMDKESRTITISSHIILYGSGANKFLAITTANDIQKSWNSAAGKVKVDGLEFNVKFVVTAEFKQDGESLREEITNNTSLKNNYFRVEKTTDQPSGTSYTDGLGSNSGYFNRNQIAHNGSTTESHEFGHGLGLDHDKTNLGYEGIRLKGQPNIMTTANDEVDKKFQGTNGFLNRDSRKVSSANMSGVFSSSIIKQLSKIGTASIGKLSNEYHKK